jgi:tetratricopeptide (TPR) repeat protein
VRPAVILWLALALVPAWGQLKERADPVVPRSPSGGLVDEDEDIVQDTTYAFNPIQARKEFKIGGFYAKKGNHRAASARFLEATKWDPGYAEAYWRLGNSREELKQYNLAIEAYRKYLQLEPGGKVSKEAQKRASRLEPLLNLPAPPHAEAGSPDNQAGAPSEKLPPGEETKPAPPGSQ